MDVKVIPKSEAEKKKLKVAAYARVSRDCEELEGSLESQIKYYEKLIKGNPEYEFVNVYSDLGISGYKERRPGFQKMMRDARAGKIDLIITKSITRFARNTDTVLKATRELKEKGIGVFFELQNMNTLTQAGELLLTVYAAFAQGESETYRELALMRFQKRFAGGRPEYQLQRVLGYTKDEDGNIVIVPEEAEVVKQIFLWVKENYATGTILKMAEERGFKKKGGQSLTSAFISTTIRNVSYKGDYIMQRTYTDENRKAHIDQDIVPSYYIENDHPAIVSKKLWNEANAMMDTRVKKNKYWHGIKEYTVENYPYKGRIFCASCGRPLMANCPREKHQYYFSCGHKSKNGEVFCTGKAVPQEAIDRFGDFEGNIYISYHPDKPIHLQYSYVKESTWKKTHTRKKHPKMMEYNEENYHFYRRAYCALCGQRLIRSRRPDGCITFVCSGLLQYGPGHCPGVRVPEEKMLSLPKWEGYYWIKEERINGEKHYSYTCKEERPERKPHVKRSRTVKA